MPKPISREYRIYLALWRRAMQGHEVKIKVPNLHMAIAMRQGMYRAIRPFRSGELDDEELLKACEKYVVYLVKTELASEPHFLELRERKALSVLTDAWDTLGIDEEDLLVGEERNIGEKLKDFVQVETKTSKTKFYER